MRRVAFHPITRAVVVIALAAVGYVFGVKTTVVDRNLLVGLVPKTSGIAVLQTKATSKEVVQASSSPFDELKSASKSDPDGVAGYSIEWTGTKKNAASGAEILLELVPTTPQAKTLRTQEVKTFLAPGSLSSENYTLTSHFNVPGVPGADAAQFSLKKTKTAAGAVSDVTVFQVGHAVATVFIDLPSHAEPSFDALTKTEDQLLVRKLSTFSFAFVKRPAGWTVLYVVGTVLVTAIVVLVPIAVMAVRRRQEERRAARVRYQYQSRGRKALKRHRVRT